MRRLWGFTILLLGFAVSTEAVLVDGQVLLNDQAEQSGTRILFREVSPSAQTDSTESDASGNYTITLAPGVYDVIFSHPGFADYPLPNRVLLFDTTIERITLMLALSGTLPAYLEPGDYHVTDDIIVDSGQVTVIDMSTHLYFEPGAALIVYGRLEAFALEHSPIFFAKRFAHPDSTWGGIRFTASSDSNFLQYCVVRDVAAPQRYFYPYQDNYRGAIVSWAQHLRLVNCSIHDNHGIRGGGIASLVGELRLEGCWISSNQAYHAGGIYVGGGTTVLDGCEIRDNEAIDDGGGVGSERAQIIMSDCWIWRNSAGDQYGGGYFRTDAEVTMTACTITSNIAQSGNGGGFGFDDAMASLDRCVFDYNSASSAGCIYCSTSQLFLTRCTLLENRAELPSPASDHITSFYSPVVMSSCILTGTSDRPDILFYSSADASIIYCDFYGSTRNPFEGLEEAPPVLGIVALTNANGDSCDTYYNIFQDPLLADTAAGDYHLRAQSPCIDAGDPELPLDPDGTIADMGAFFYNQDAAAPEREAVARDFILHPNYPNPFNAETHLAFDLPSAGPVTLTVYDVTGREVATLANALYPAGRHELRFDGSHLATGLYFARLASGPHSAIQKLVLMK